METMAKPDDDDVGDGKAAVIGLACRFPGAPDAHTYWENLLNGVESVERFDESNAARGRFGTEGVPGDAFVGAEALIPGVNTFDHELFGYTLGEARRIDPQLRIGLQCAHEALEDAACGGMAADDGKIGVFFAASMSTYLIEYLLDQNMDGLGALLGNDKDHIATTIAYRLGLTGPAVNVGSGCSSSASALHYACLSLATYQCDVAVVGGASIIFPQGQGHVYRDGGIYSKDGHCRPFSADASGTVGGSGVGVVVLKRRDDAVRGNHGIYCVVAGSACGNDGRRKAGYAAPSVDGQVETIHAALATAEADPARFAYVEAHGTATELGDPIEVDALGRSFGRTDGEAAYCALGSVKANIGHLDCASGIASVIKAALCVHKRERPRQIFFEKGHPLINWETSPFHVEPTGGSLYTREDARYVGVNSLGMGGTNAFFVLEPAPERASSDTDAPRSERIVVSGHRADVLVDNIRSLHEFVRSQRPNLADLAYTLCVGRTAHAYRAAFICEDTDDLLEHLARRVHSEGVEDAFVDHFDDPLLAEWLAGKTIDWSGHFSREARRLHLPSYAYRTTRCWPHDRAFPAWRRAVAEMPDRESVPVGEASHRDARRAIEEYCVCLVRDFLEGRGVDCTRRGAFTRTDLICRLGLAPAYSRLGEYLIDTLIERGYLAYEPPHATPTAAFDLPETLAVKAATLEHWPEYAPLVQLLWKLSLHWTYVVCDGGSALEALPGDGYGAIAAALACDVNKSAAIDAQLDRIETFLRALSIELGRPLRLLEVGCGHLTLTNRLLGTNAANHIHEYWVTDSDEKYVKRAQAIFSGTSGSAAVRFATFDIDRKPADQGFHGEFDVVLGFNVFHVARDLRTALANLADVLGDEGIACQIDAVDSCLSTQLIWGMLPEWWNFRDTRANGPLMTVDGYRSLLESTCRDYTLVPDNSESPDSLLWFASPERRAADESFAPGWRRIVGAQDQAWRAGEVVLFFADDSDIRARFDAFAASHRLTMVCITSERKPKSHPDDTVLSPDCGDGMRAIVETVLARYGRIDRIVFAWEMPPLRDAPDDVLSGSLGMLHGAATAFEAELGDAPVELLLVSRGLYRIAGNETVRAEASLALDMSRMIELEYPQFRLRHIEVPIHGTLNSRAFEAACTTENNASTIAVRGRHLWRPVYEPVELANASSAVDLNEAVVVLVGGLGGLGLRIARQLVSRYRLHLVVIHRAKWLDADPTLDHLDEKDACERARVRELLAELAGSALSLQTELADVNDRDDIFAVAERIRIRHTRIDGILYLAGEIDRGGVLRNRMYDDLAHSVRTKTFGVINATDALATLNPTFQVNFSSIGSILHKAKFGEAGYVVGNGFLNAHARAEDDAPFKIVCVNWTDWSTDGMWADAQAEFRERYSVSSPRIEAETAKFDGTQWLEPISEEHGVDMLLRIIGSDHSEIAVCNQELPELLDYQRRASHSDYAHYLDRLDLRAVAPRDRTAHGPTLERSGTADRLASIWQELLGTPVDGPDDNFYTAGGDSLLALRLSARVKQMCGVDLPLSTLLEARTFGALVASIDEMRTVASGAPEIHVGL